MKIDTSDYYPVTPGYSCGEPEENQTDSIMESYPSDRTDSDSGESPREESQSPVTEEGVRPGKKGDKDAEGETWERVVDRISNVLSWVFVPLMMPLYALLISFHISVLQFAPYQTKWVFCLIIFCITTVVPMLLILILKRIGIVDDLGLNGRKERLLPYIISIATLGAAGWFMIARGAPLWTGMFFFGGALAGLINMIVNLWWKISAHAAAAAGVVALLVCISREPIPHPGIEIWVACAIGVAGLLGAARVWLGRHTVLQVIAGSAVGFLSVFFLTLI